MRIARSRRQRAYNILMTDDVVHYRLESVHRFCVRLVISASALPSPAVNDPVRLAATRGSRKSSAWIPGEFAYCLFLKNICMSDFGFSALGVPHEVKPPARICLMELPFMRHEVVIGEIAQLRLLPSRAVMSMPMTDAMSAARCMDFSVSYSDFCCSTQEP